MGRFSRVIIAVTLAGTALAAKAGERESPLSDPGLLARWDVRIQAFRLGSAAIPQLIEALELGEDDPRQGSIAVLARLGRKARRAVPALLRIARDPEHPDADRASRALFWIAPSIPDLLPCLLRCRSEEDPDLIETIEVADMLEAWPDLPVRLARLLRNADLETRRAAARLTARLTEIPPVLGSALRAALDAGISQAAVPLARLDPGDVTLAPPLIDLLETPTSFFEQETGAFEALRSFGPRLRPLAHRIARVYESGDRYKQRWAACLLSRAGDASVAVSALLSGLRGAFGDHAAQLAAAWLPEFPETAPIAVPLLVETLPRPSHTHLGACTARSSSSPWAAEALGRFGPLAVEAVPALVELLRTELSVEAAVALRRIGPAGLAALAAATQDASSSVVRIAVCELASADESAKTCVGVLRLVARTNDDEVVRSRAFIALLRLGLVSTESLEEAVARVKDGSAVSPAWQADLAGEAGRPLEEAGAESADLALRVKCKLALWKPGRCPEGLIEDLLARIRGGDKWCGEKVAVLGAETAPLILGLAEFLSGSDGDARDSALAVLENLGPLSSPATEALAKLVSSSGPEPFQDSPGERAARALGEIGPAARAALPALRAALEEFPTRTRAAARSAIRRIEER